MRAALWILSSHVTLSTLGGHIKDGGLESRKYMRTHYIIKNARTYMHACNTLLTHKHTEVRTHPHVAFTCMGRGMHVGTHKEYSRVSAFVV